MNISDYIQCNSFVLPMVMCIFANIFCIGNIFFVNTRNVSQIGVQKLHITRNVSQIQINKYNSTEHTTARYYTIIILYSYIIHTLFIHLFIYSYIFFFTKLFIHFS